MSILIRNVQVIDGTGSEPYKADVFINNKIIAGIGDLKKKEADEVIDGSNAYLVPGFIDLDGSIDHDISILTDSQQDELKKRGITTSIGGHYGLSLAPLLYGSLESLPNQKNARKINIDWHSVREFLAALKKIPLGVNFGTFMGYDTIKYAICGKDRSAMTKDEFSVFQKVVKDGIREGAFGLSFSKKILSNDEFKILARIVKEAGGIISLDAPSKETLKTAEGVGVRIWETKDSSAEPAHWENPVELPKIVKNRTFVMANLLGIKDRGIIKEGLVADLTLLDKNDYKVKYVVLGGRSALGTPLKHH